MRISAETTTRINWMLDNLLPPVLRDILVKLMILLLFKNEADIYLNIKAQAPYMSPDDFNTIYSKLQKDILKRDTDLNKQSLEMILNETIGPDILDIACGKGYLAKLLSKESGYNVTGIDFKLDNALIHENYANMSFFSGDIYSIPFPDNHFNTVICAHTLEHLLNVNLALSELRRVCKNRLIIIVPKQREYRYGFNLHINFFPYEFSLLKTMNNPEGVCHQVGLDLCYIENVCKDG